MVASASTLIPPHPSADSSLSSSGTFNEDHSSDSLFSPSSHYVIKCNVNPTAAPRVKVTVQQPSIRTRSSRFDAPADSSLLQTPASNTLSLMSTSTSTTSSAPECSISGASSADELASYGRQSNPSPELRKNSFDDWIKLEQRYLPRSKSELNTMPTEASYEPTKTVRSFVRFLFPGDRPTKSAWIISRNLRDAPR